MEVTGTVIHVDTQKGTSRAGKVWEKKIFVIEYLEGTVKKQLAFEMFGSEKIQENPFRNGQQVTVYFDIQSTEWNGRWFTSLSAWRVAKPGTSSTPTESSLNNMSSDYPQDDNDELPF